jgi:3-oxoadipate enol-lactonase
MGHDRTQLLELDHGTIQIDVDGTGIDLLVIHSLLTGPEAFDSVVAASGDRIRFHRLHLPGFGESSPLPDRDISIRDLADVVAAAIAEAGLTTETSVLGNGLGSFVALALAIRNGQAFDRLIVANTGPGFPPERRAPFVNMSETAESEGMANVADLAIPRIFPEAYIDAHPEAPDERRAVLESIEPGAFAAACRALAKLDLSAELSAVSNPTMVIAGEIDQTTPPEMGEIVAAGIPGSRIEIIADCGHCPQLEQPTQLASLIDDFLLGSSAG